MKIEVLGTGCKKCHMLESAARAAADRLGVDYSLEHVTDINKLTEYGVMMTPALVVNGKVKVVGRLPSETELEILLQE